MAIPAILQQLGQSSPLAGQLKQVANLMRGDPSALLSRFTGPQMQEAQRLIQAAGGDAQKAFYDLARKNGVDPNDILNMIR